MININTKTENYKIHIKNGILNNIEKIIDFSRFSKVVILTDENLVNNNWLHKLPNFDSIVIKPGESNKNFNAVADIWKQMNDLSMDRKSLLINFGGGVICDLGGFCASTYMRGIEFLQIPTTLLSQVDASVGGKTGFDFNGVKNIIGTFSSPSAVVIDSNTLKTLPKREYISGFAEVIKYGIIHDREFFEYLKNSSKTDNEYIIEKCCNIKADIVSNDFKENGLRKILNFGHTVGHSIETLSLKSTTPLLHGEAIAIGMVAESIIAKEINNITNKELESIINTIEKYDLPIKYSGNLEEIYLMLFRDKKNISNKIKWVLPNGIGRSIFDMDITENIIKNAIKEVLK